MLYNMYGQHPYGLGRDDAGHRRELCLFGAAAAVAAAQAGSTIHPCLGTQTEQEGWDFITQVQLPTTF